MLTIYGMQLKMIMKIVGCYTDYMKCVAMTDEEKKHQSEPLKKNLN